MTPDVNVLVAAFRVDHPHHGIARPWLTTAVASALQGGALLLMPMVAASFLRLVTSSKIFASPDPVADALAFVNDLLSRPGVHMPTLGPEWPVLAKLSVDMGLAGNDIPGAWLAAAVLSRGDHLVTFDKDFRRLLKSSQLTLLG